MSAPSLPEPLNQEPNQQFQEDEHNKTQTDPSHSPLVSAQDFQNPPQSDQNNDTQQAVGPEKPPEIAEPPVESGSITPEVLGEGQVQIQHQQNAYYPQNVVGGDQQNLGLQGLNPAAAAAVAALSQLTQFAGNMGDVERAMVELQGLIAAGGLGAFLGAAPFMGQGPPHYAPALLQISHPPYRGGGRRGVDRYRRGGRGNFGNRGRGRWTPRENPQQILSSGPGNLSSEATNSVEARTEASAVNIDQGAQADMPTVQPNVTTSGPQRHIQVYRCEICTVDCNSLEILEQHKGGKKHKKNLQKLEEQKTCQPVFNVQSNAKSADSYPAGKLQPENMQNSEGNKETISENLHSETVPVENNLENQPQNPETQQLDNQKSGMKRKRKMRTGRGGGKRSNTHRWPKEPKVAAPLICNLCNVTCDTQEVFNRHLSGKKHKSKYKRFESHQAMYGPAELQVLYPPNPVMQTLSQPQDPLQNIFASQSSNLFPPGAHTTPQIHPAGAPSQSSDGNQDHQLNLSGPQDSNPLPPGVDAAPQFPQVHQQ
ncbi:uncharacterized protein LOC108209578 isoform X1 [Daucus carota subsp. sativus]|uniref:uncharacterized protein LOC108209578 isoform X1 n=1 Tax=Daucus carota subsp. sativus TaxID=79200 RepID=UPI0007EFA603|nr:PREDICTED: uncharacterized protein LOC108209578 isoform X1 [Daucus carota subsp. sativus]